jgi:DGQHR domain-containing protein
MEADRKLIRRRALSLSQSKQIPLYMFSLTGDEILDIADISRLSRNEAGKLLGYQRREVKNHIDQIVQYLEGENVLFPNAIILALSSEVCFKGSRGPRVDDGISTSGIIEIPVPKPNQTKPAWIVDGQQRVLAISKSNKLNLPVPVTAFVSDRVELQRDQFLRVNSIRALPSGLITELLPEITTTLPPKLAAKKVPSALCDLLNSREDSPFKGLIRRASSLGKSRKKAVVGDTSIVKMIQQSLDQPSGCLFPYRNYATGETDFEGIISVLITYWNAVKLTFPDAWGKAPAKSRLMHGAGIISMGRLMDRIMGAFDPRQPDAIEKVKNELAVIAPICKWTSGLWEDLGVRWNGIENTPKSIKLLTNHIIRSYLQGKQAVS